MKTTVVLLALGLWAAPLIAAQQGAPPPPDVGQVALLQITGMS